MRLIIMGTSCLHAEELHRSAWICLCASIVWTYQSPCSPQHMCVSFTVRWSYSSIHKHPEIQMAKHSTAAAWCKLQTLSCNWSPDVSLPKSRVIPSKLRDQNDTGDRTPFKTMMHMKFSSSSSRGCFFGEKFLLQSSGWEMLSPVRETCDLHTNTLKRASCSRSRVWTLNPELPVSEQVLCLHWCHIVYYSSFLPQAGYWHETDKPQDEFCATRGTTTNYKRQERHEDFSKRECSVTPN